MGDNVSPDLPCLMDPITSIWKRRIKVFVHFTIYDLRIVIENGLYVLTQRNPGPPVRVEAIADAQTTVVVPVAPPPANRTPEKQTRQLTLNAKAIIHTHTPVRIFTITLMLI